MVKAWIALLIVLLSLGLFANDKEMRSIRLIVKTPFNTPVNDSIYLTGAGNSFCDWNPRCLKFRKIDHQLFSINLNLIDHSKLLEFKVTRGDWSTQACTQKGEILQNYELMLSSGSLEYIITIENWCDKKANALPEDVVRLNNFDLKFANEKRNISVFLPSSYHKKINNKFPVIYVHDGQNAIDPETSAFGKEWGIDETIETLIERKQSEGFIVVAIPCHCRERNAEYNYFEKGESFAKSIVNDLVPYIDDQFRTIASREGRYIMGSSMGALISFSMLWEYPYVFKAAAGLSFPAFAFDYFIFKVAEKFSVPEDTHFYLDHGGTGQDATYDEARELFLNHLNSLGINPQQVVFKHFPYDGHNEVDWANRVNIPLTFFEKFISNY